MKEELKVGASITGYMDGTITREEVIDEYHNQLKLIAYMPWCPNPTQTDIVKRVAEKLLEDVSYNVDGLEIDEINWWDEDEVIDFINECIDSISEYEEEPDGQLVLFDPAPYEKSPAEINLEQFNRFYELKKQTERAKKSLDKS